MGDGESLERAFRRLDQPVESHVDVDAARVSVHAALEDDPVDAVAWNALGVLSAAAGDVREAMAAFRNALAIDPGNADAAWNEAELRRSLGGGGRQRGGLTFAAVCCIFDDCTWLHAAIGSVYSECAAVYVLVSDRPWNGPPRDNSTALSLIGSVPDPEQKIEVVRGTWSTEAEQRNAGLDLLAARGIDYCMILDSDEIYDDEELPAMIGLVRSAPDIACWHVSLVTYWKSARFRIDPPEPLRPPTFVRVGAAHFDINRNVVAKSRALIDTKIGVCHHMSYARSNDELRRKLASFSHAHEVVPGWYEDVWLKWDEQPGLMNLHPTHPPCYARAVEQPAERLPRVLRRSHNAVGATSVTALRRDLPDVSSDRAANGPQELEQDASVTFETKCWEGDWALMLTTPFLRAQIERNRAPFDHRVLLINNVDDPGRVARHADRLVAEGVLSAYHVVDEHTQDALEFFGLSHEALGRGYVYSIAELVSLYLCRTTYLLHFAGDCILDAEVPWVADSLQALEANRTAVVANPIWDHRFDEVAAEAFAEEGSFFIGQGFSDQCYLVRTSDLRDRIYGESHPYSERYPSYGGELFEKRVDAWMRNHGRSRLTHRGVSYRHLRGIERAAYCRAL